MSAAALIAPDSFKGTLRAAEVADAVAAGLEEAGARAVRRPIGDGGEGTLDALLEALPGAQTRTATVDDPLGRPVEARFGLLADGGTAIVEMAEASGLHRVAAAECDAWAASTRGTGQLIAAAAAAGAEHVLVTVGGSATTDGGAGALAALDEAGAAPRLTVLCDVTSPWADAARVFAPQKGADDGTVRRLAQRLDALAARAPRDPRGVAMTGAAGGLAGGLWAFRGAELVPGAERVLDLLGFDALLAGADVVVTGEGALDEQTFAGKAVGAVAARCRAAGVPCWAVVGADRLGPGRARALGLAGVLEATDSAALRAAGRRLAQARRR
ncbi:MAG TPA: glycerate kinase [Capillimicrobium sp.]